MDLVEFYALYRSAQATSTGCVKEFVSVAKPAANFPPGVSYLCDLCNTGHRFHLVRTISAATPLQHKRFAQYCQTNGIETGVVVGAG